MKLKILLFVAVAFVASSQASRIPDGMDSLLTGGSPYPTPASTGISGIATGFGDVQDQIRVTNKNKGDTLLVTLEKLKNKTYSPPDNFLPCLKGKDGEIKKNLTDLTKTAKTAAKNLQNVHKELKESLKNYTDGFKGLKKKFWTPLKKGNYKDALKGFGKIEKVVQKAMKDVMVKLVNDNANSEQSGTTAFNEVNKKWIDLKKGVNSTIIECLEKISSETSKN